MLSVGDFWHKHFAHLVVNLAYLVIHAIYVELGQFDFPVHMSKSRTHCVVVAFAKAVASGSKRFRVARRFQVDGEVDDCMTLIWTKLRTDVRYIYSLLAFR